MKKALCAFGAGLLVAGAAQAVNYGATLADGTNITTAVVVGAGDRWQQTGTSITVGLGGSIDVQGSSETANMTVGQSNTSSITIDGGLLVFNGPNSLLIGNGGTGSGSIDLLSGSFSADPGATLFIGRDGADGLLTIRGGAAVLGQLPSFDAAGGSGAGNGSIDFADKIGGGSSDGTLTITGADLSYYQGLVIAGDLTYNGATPATFGDVFEVTGETIRVIPEPVTLGLVAAFGGGILFIRRLFMI
ncbi:hypothetical protein P4C99_06380 [Pontiellaceae bacterium B1224]|nr:hypothetical protein [Pontiellaceae bacterium B1224]